MMFLYYYNIFQFPQNHTMYSMALAKLRYLSFSVSSRELASVAKKSTFMPIKVYSQHTTPPVDQ